MGVLVGTSLIVIVPEGFETLYSSRASSLKHTKREFVTTKLDSRWSLEAEPWHERRVALDANPIDGPGPVIPDSLGSDVQPPKTPTDPGVVGILGTDSKDEKETDSEKAESDHDHDDSPHAWAGVALIAGFVLMYLIDKVPQCASSSRSDQRPYHISLNDLGRGFHRVSTTEEGELEPFQPEHDHAGVNRSFATTIGLVIHAAADGIALGASSTTPSTSLSFIIFFAIMIHKAPAAFGLTSILLRQGLSKRSARGHLLLFSVAAPLGALLTWGFAHSVGAGRVGNDQSTKWWTGILLLFSGGTFLYVAMHTMEENTSGHSEPPMNGNANGYIDGRESHQKEQRPSVKDLSAAVVGMILPLLLQVGHVH